MRSNSPRTSNSQATPGKAGSGIARRWKKGRSRPNIRDNFQPPPYSFRSAPEGPALCLDSQGSRVILGQSGGVSLAWQSPASDGISIRQKGRVPLVQLRIRTGNSTFWLLLGHAVHRAQAPDEIAGVDGDNLASGEKLSECVESDAVIGEIEDRRQHDSVGDIEIRIAGRQAAAFEDHRLGHGQFDDRQLFAVLIARAL